MTDTVLLRGIVGSTAYGLAGPDSDVDRLAMHAAPTADFHGLTPPIGKAATRVQTDPDIQSHEAAKFVRLVLDGNPTVTELLWLPEHLYEVRHPLADELIAMRGRLLHAKGVRNAYLGYAAQQLKRVREEGSFPSIAADRRDRNLKHSRHLYRLVEQGTAVWTTGALPIEVRSPEMVREFAERVADGEHDYATGLLARAELTFDRVPTVLPEQPDREAADRWLRRVRAEPWEAAA